MDLAQFSLFDWYMFVFLICGVLFLFSMTNKRGSAVFVSIAVAVVVSYIAAKRTGIGDTQTYLGHFYRSASTWDEFLNSFIREGEWGFTFFAFLIKWVTGNNGTAYLFICSFIMLGGLMHFFRKCSSNVALCFLVYCFSGAFVSGLNGVRQAMVASVFVASYSLIENKKIIKYIVLCLILSTVHQSALILIPMIYLLNMKAWGKGTWCLLAASVLLYIGYPLFAGVLTALLSGSSYEIYSNGIQNFTNGGANILRVLVLSVPILLAFLFRDELEDNFPHFNICLNGAMLSFMFMFVATIRSWIFARFCVYFNPFSIVLLSESLQFSGKNKAILTTSCVIAYSIFFAYEMLSINLV